jgi:hypothetical protein
MTTEEFPIVTDPQVELQNRIARMRADADRREEQAMELSTNPPVARIEELAGAITFNHAWATILRWRASRLENKPRS